MEDDGRSSGLWMFVVRYLSIYSMELNVFLSECECVVLKGEVNV